jgi:hypothetical protein
MQFIRLQRIMHCFYRCRQSYLQHISRQIRKTASLSRDHAFVSSVVFLGRGSHKLRFIGSREDYPRFLHGAFRGLDSSIRR